MNISNCLSVTTDNFNFVHKKQKTKNIINSFENKKTNLLPNTFFYPVNFKGVAIAEKTTKDINKNIKKILDSSSFYIEDSSEKETTIKEFIKDNILRVDENIEKRGLLHGTSFENREQIIKNGFDQNKISRTVCGPGTCFSNSEHEATIFGGPSIVSCDFVGNMATVTNGFFPKLLDNQNIRDLIAEENGIDIENRVFSESFFDEEKAIDKSLEHYVRGIFKELSIDGTHDLGKYPSVPSCFVVFNTESIKNIKKYN